MFTRSGGVWSQQGAKLVGTGAVGSARQGTSVALSGDGNTLVVGGRLDNSSTGAAWVFTRSGGVWSQQGAKLVGTGRTGPRNRETPSRCPGTGTPRSWVGQDNSGVGAAWVFTRSGGVWSQQGAKLVGTGAVGGALQGTSVAVSADGNTAVVGGCADNSGRGRHVGVHAQRRRVEPAGRQAGRHRRGRSAGQGFSVAVSADGNTAVVGGWQDNTNAGATWVFVRSSPEIVSVKDVPNDQGGRVNIRWTASPADGPPGYPISAYWIWRQVPALFAAKTPVEGAHRAIRGSGRALRQSVVNGQTYYWELVGSQPAHHHPGYSFTAETLLDSVPGSNPYTFFMVEGEEAATGEFWPSPPDSGYSVDNLPPGPPAPFTAAHAGGVTHLHWGVNAELDFAVYRLHRGDSEGFVPGPGNLVSAQPDTGFGDVGAAGGYYKLSAVDVHGNVSAFALITPSATLGVPGASLPLEFSLSPVAPNPLRDGATFRYAIPRDASPSLAILDASGRRVRVLARGPRPAGAYTLHWDGRDAAGHQIPAGIYFLRLDAAGRSLTSRFAVIH